MGDEDFDCGAVLRRLERGTSSVGSAAALYFGIKRCYRLFL